MRPEYRLSILGIESTFLLRPSLRRQSLIQQRLNHRLPADVELGRLGIQIAQHAMRQVDVHPAYRPHHGELIRKEAGYIFAARRHLCDFVHPRTRLSNFPHNTQAVTK